MAKNKHLAFVGNRILYKEESIDEYHKKFVQIRAYCCLTYAYKANPGGTAERHYMDIGIFDFDSDGLKELGCLVVELFGAEFKRRITYELGSIPELMIAPMEEYPEPACAVKYLRFPQFQQKEFERDVLKALNNR